MDEKSSMMAHSDVLVTVYSTMVVETANFDERRDWRGSSEALKVTERFTMVDPDTIPKLLAAGTIEVAPLAYMRGRSLNDSFIILDEAQNTTPEQMKMFLTRIGFGSKAVVTGDVTQIDLARGQKSGLIEARRILAGVRGIAFTEFGAQDVVRHPLVARIIDAYEQRAHEA